MNLETTTWNCFGCAHEIAEASDMPQFCPKCGGVWARRARRRASTGRSSPKSEIDAAIKDLVAEQAAKAEEEE